MDNGFCIIRNSDLDEMQEIISEYIQRGYKLHGLLTEMNNGQYYMQCVVKYPQVIDKEIKEVDK